MFYRPFYNLVNLEIIQNMQLFLNKHHKSVTTLKANI